MGKQVNYYMDYESFLKLAERALSEGCMILKNDHTEEPQQPQNDVSAITEDCMRYYFYLPELAELQYKRSQGGQYYIDAVSNKLTLALIEAGFSKKSSGRNGRLPCVNIARLYIPTGVWLDGVWYQRSDRITSVYNKLARFARKLAPRTTIEIDDIVFDEKSNVLPVKKEATAWVSPECLEWRHQGYELYWLLASKESTKNIIRQNSGKNSMQSGAASLSLLVPDTFPCM